MNLSVAYSLSRKHCPEFVICRSKVVLHPIRIDDVHVLDGLGKRNSSGQLEGNRTQAIVVQIDPAREGDNRVNLGPILFRQLIAEILPNLRITGVLKAEVVVEPARAIDEVVVELVELVAGHDKQLLASGDSIEQA